MASEEPQSPTPSEAAMAAAVAERLMSTTPSTTDGTGGAKKTSEQAPQSSSNTTSSFGLSLPLRENSKNQFNLAKARADAAAAAAAAAAGIAGSLSSTYRSRRQSGSSQVSFSSKYVVCIYPFALRRFIIQFLAVIVHYFLTRIIIRSLLMSKQELIAEL